MRINKLLSNYGICSRKEARQLIEDERIIVNGKMCIQGQWVEETDDILLDNEKLKPKEKVYILFNKPRGITCTRDGDVKDNIKDYLSYPDYIFPVGRLDKESEGIIIMTNDGNLANSILESDNMHEKEYLVKVDKEFDDDFLKNMASGVKILDTVTRPCILERVDDYSFKITLTQGLNRQIRRMCKAFGYNVIFLQRIRILNLNIEGIEEGSWRYLTKEEVQYLKRKMRVYINASAYIENFKDNLDKAAAEMNEYRILTILNSRDVKSYNENKEWAEKSEYIKPVFGIHPEKAEEFKEALESLIPYIEESTSIGEIGLDYTLKESQARQKEIFKFILKEAAKRNKPCSIYIKGAEEEVYQELKDLNYNKVVINCCGAGVDTVQKFINLGCYIALSDDFDEAVLKRVPLEKLFLKTAGLPKEIMNVYKKAAALKEMDLIEFEDALQENAMKLKLY